MICRYPNCDGGNATGYCHSDCASLYEAAQRDKEPKRDTRGRISHSHTEKRMANKCPGCGRMFVDGETCSMGGCPVGGDF